MSEQLDKIEQRIIDLDTKVTSVMVRDNAEIFKLLEKAEAKLKAVDDYVCEKMYVYDYQRADIRQIITTEEK